METKILKEVRAVYESGRLSLAEPLDVPEGTVVQVIIKPAPEKKQEISEASSLKIRTLPASSLDALIGIVSLGGDALKDSEALYDPNW
ncbi:MAG: antitoxin family protein [Chloroflexi bacterium]|nr:antitoxin family protein [Chloroflexota bacterium]